MLLTDDRFPRALTTFVGRRSEKAEIVRLLAGARLLTVTGVGGVGKTRLAVEAADELAPGFLNGAWFIDLAATSDQGDVLRAVAKALDVHESSERHLLDAIVCALTDQRTLLILDNCEQVIEAAGAIVPPLLRRCGAITILATSREPLGIDGEVVWRLHGLSLASDDVDASVAKPRAPSEALELFLERARAAAPSMSWDASEIAAAAELVRAVEGIPLGIELAAARVNAIPVQELATRLHQSMRVLGSETSRIGSRQQTLWSTIDWSYRLLSADEEALFRRLSVFRGGATVDAAEAVCTDETLCAGDVGGVLVRLVEKSLVTAAATEGGAVRYRLLEPLRQYARDQLEASGEATAIDARHGEHFAAFADACEDLLRGSKQIETIWRIEAEHDNVRAAIAHSLKSGECVTATRIVSSLSRFWLIRGHFGEGLRWAEATLECVRDDDPMRGRVLKAAAIQSFGLGQMADAVAYMTRSVEAERRTGDACRLAEALLWLGTAFEVDGQSDRARAAAEEAMPLIPAGDAWLTAHALRVFAHAEKHDTGDVGRVLELHEQEYDACMSSGDTLMTANVLNCLGECHRWAGDRARAKVMYDESISRRVALGDRLGMVQSMLNMGLLGYESRDLVAAERALVGALQTSLQIGNNRYMRAVLLGFAGVAVERGRPEQSARFLGMTAAERPDRRLIDASDQKVYDEIEARCRTEIGDRPFQLAWESGTLASLDGALAEARAFVDEITAVRQPSASNGSLTDREAEVLRLLTRGLSNRAIAERLVVSVRTVETHVAHIYSKLGVTTRVQATSYAIEHGLAEAGAAASAS